jgi:hypothetical protein
VIRKESVVSAIIAVRLAIHPTPVDKIAPHVVDGFADIQNHRYSRQRGESSPPSGKVLETQESPAITPRSFPSRLGETRPSASYCEVKALLWNLFYTEKHLKN